MLTVQTEFSCPDLYLRAAGLDPAACVFFDIETTGFRAASSHLYLIGAAVRMTETPSQWKLIQWLAEKPQEEALLLRAFAAFLPGDAVLVHFNGDRFDIPYLEEKYAGYGIPSPLSSLRSDDLYRDYRGLRGFLGMQQMKLTAIEQFLRLHRDDTYDGGRLIEVYRTYSARGSKDLEHLLLLHNREDVEGTVCITAMQGYLSLQKAAAEGTLDVTGVSIEDGCACFSFAMPVPVPCAVRKELEFLASPKEDPQSGEQRDRQDVRPLYAGPPVLTLNEGRGHLRIPLWEGTLRYFFADYRSYWYLPMEDEAIHKSVACFVDREQREPATRYTCYTRRSGTFLPQPAAEPPALSPALARVYKDTLLWTPWDEKTAGDGEAAKAYVSAVITRAFL